jgi:NAD(P)-dependent dehydrogenase (short-subunit alcohol dehydrogenase family)
MIRSNSDWVSLIGLVRVSGTGVAVFVGSECGGVDGGPQAVSAPLTPSIPSSTACRANSRRDIPLTHSTVTNLALISQCRVAAIDTLPVEETSDMTRRRIIITGASDGIGAAAARRLNRSGYDVVVVGRSQSKTTAIATELGADYFVADFADLSQVRALAEKIRSEYPRIDVLANNAGCMVREIHLTADGFEKTYQVNYFAPFLLTTQLLDLLVDSRATILNTTSSSQKLLPRVTISDLENTNKHRPSTAYALTKVAIVLFTMELHRRYHASGLSAAAFHPGYVNSNFGQASGSRFLTFMQRKQWLSGMTATVEQGAEQLVWLASSTPGVDWTSGVYYSKHKVAKANRAAYDPALARELWDRTIAKLG